MTDNIMVETAQEVIIEWAQESSNPVILDHLETVKLFRKAAANHTKRGDLERARRAWANYEQAVSILGSLVKSQS